MPLLVLLLFSVALPAFGEATPASGVVVVGRADNVYHERFVSALRARLGGADADGGIRFESSGRFAADAAPDRTVIVLGSEAARRVAALRRSGPTIYAMLPESLFEALYGPRPPPANVTAVYIDQPLARFITLIRVALPRVEDVATLFGPYSRQYRERIARLSGAAGLHLHSQTISRSAEVGAAIDRLARPGSVMLTLPDHTVLNSTTAKTVILGTYLHRVPLIGYSHALVKAGAVMGIYSTPAQMARQVADIVAASEAGRRLPAAGHPRRFSVSVNYQVARVLGLSLPGENVIHRRMLAAETPR